MVFWWQVHLSFEKSRKTFLSDELSTTIKPNRANIMCTHFLLQFGGLLNDRKLIGGWEKKNPSCLSTRQTQLAVTFCAQSNYNCKKSSYSMFIKDACIVLNINSMPCHAICLAVYSFTWSWVRVRMHSGSFLHGIVSFFHEANV